MFTRRAHVHGCGPLLPGARRLNADYSLGDCMTRLTLVALSTLCAPLALAQDFSGTWQWTICDKRNPSRDCGGLTLVLVQRGKAICGRHSAAPIGLSVLDEGDAHSVFGTASGRKAIVTIRSGRSGKVGKAELLQSGSSLIWQLVDEPDGDYYLPEKGKSARVERNADDSFVNETLTACAESPKSALQPTPRSGAVERGRSALKGGSHHEPHIP